MINPVPVGGFMTTVFGSIVGFKTEAFGSIVDSVVGRGGIIVRVTTLGAVETTGSTFTISLLSSTVGASVEVTGAVGAVGAVISLGIGSGTPRSRAQLYRTASFNPRIS
jgi:hypothetical protein